MNNPDLKPYECSANSAEVKAIVPLGHVSARHFSRMKKPDVQMTIAFSSDTVHVGDAPIYSHAHLLDAHAAGVNDGFDLWNIDMPPAPEQLHQITPFAHIPHGAYCTLAAIGFDVQTTLTILASQDKDGQDPDQRLYSADDLRTAFALGARAPAWNLIATPPDADETVMLFCAESDEPVWPGYFDGAEWFHVEGSRAAPSYWSAMPEGPKS